MTYDPMDDGLTHINVYSQGATELGRLLSNIPHTPFVHPLFGNFNSMEGYWYWISTGRQFEELRHLTGFRAKQFGRQHPRHFNPGFQVDIIEGLECKLEQNPHILEMLVASELPLVHYYVFNGRVVTPEGSEWLMEALENLRTRYQNAPA